MITDIYHYALPAFWRCLEKIFAVLALTFPNFQMSFVNSIATTKGGRHVDHVAKMIENNVADTLKKKNKGGIEIKPHQVRKAFVMAYAVKTVMQPPHLP